MYTNHELGKQGENCACKFLERKGYQIIQRNFSCKQGEIDIIAKDKEEYVFVEVKTRHNFHYGMPSEAVTYRKQKHLCHATKYYLYLHKLEKVYVRFDIIEIIKRKEQFYFNHIKQVI